MRNPRAFTLIELLVVVTIIVILLALLAPAMDRAIYLAELAKCAAQMRGFCTSTVMRATEYQRKYPQRQILDVGHQQPGQLRFHTATIVAEGVVIGDKAFDDRAVMLPYYQRYDWLTCPLVGGPMDLGNSMLPEVRSTYQLWFGFAIYYSGSQNYGAMRRLGDRWKFDDKSGQGTRAFSLLASDWDFQQERGSAPRFNSSHPDAEGKMTLARYPNEEIPTALRARWELLGNSRPPVDMNHAFEDLSVVQIYGLNGEDVKEERTVAVPHRAGDTDYHSEGWKVFVPPG